MGRIPPIQELMQSDYTKKDLEALFDVSDNTVITTLKACGLTTSSRQYTREEVSERFLPARQMFESGKSSTEIADFFAIKHAELKEEKLSDGPTGVEQEAAFADLIEDQMIEGVYQYAYERAGSVVPLLGGIFLEALRNRVIDEDRNIRGKRVRDIAKRWRPNTYLNGSVDGAQDTNSSESEKE
ncbi:MAG: hypothetical protein KME10_24240 [Plectolyngbya sp. WJT66-NPBG17]|jgi:hypothetical protein|nr:hypothetical protein [Plectolyngbya sp. WJT66-NPBG17]